MKRLIVLLILLSGISSFSQSLTEKYFNALEDFRYEEAYSYLADEAKKTKSIEEFKSNFPEILLRGFRGINDKIFRFEMVEETPGDTKEIQVKTLSPYAPDATFMPVSVLYKWFNEQLMANAKEEGVAYNPDYIVSISEKQKKPFLLSELIYTINETSTGIMLDDGKLVEVEKILAEKLAKKKEIERWEAEIIQYQWNNSKDYNLKEAIDHMRSYKDRIPNSWYITNQLPEYEKIYKTLSLLKISFDTKQPVEEHGHDMYAYLENNSGQPIETLYIWYEFKDDAGNRVIPYSDLREYDEQVIPAGYKGKIKIPFMWDDIEIIKQSNYSAIEIKWIEFPR